ncbi:MAG: hypothetical protein GWN67_04565 [Phycisphaerae bacterium]|nr:hypothetical protein [Phycisphaerae bacterium]NIP51196.1 hypothetical protein [Phycisphaerae bacterium]NIS50407.1 hypothetical protein [Phycisphaerae bacterium]NIU08137.1 hypothetical protein [Phycisphaerae bacterium]NIU55680.1 hypothetical protein [Phycisphaerae bacterium]
MVSTLVARIDGELVTALFFSSAAFIGLSFLTILAVRSVPNKLLLLGLLMAIAAIAFAAILPSASKLAIAMMIPAILLILIGAICLAIGFVVKLIKTEKSGQSQA